MTSKTTAVYDPKPMAYKAVRVWLSDGSRMLGMWTGVKWWSTKGEIKPVRWELEERGSLHIPAKRFNPGFRVDSRMTPATLSVLIDNMHVDEVQ
jgi:hypothetical protein